VDEAALHHLHPVIIELLLLLLVFRVGSGLFLATLAALVDAVVCQQGKEKHETGDGAGDDDDASCVGEGIPFLFESMGLVEFLERGGFAAVKSKLAWQMKRRGRVDLRYNLDALSVAGLVTVGVLDTGRVVLDVHFRHVHGKGHVLETRLAASPLDDALSILVWVAAGPNAHAHCVRGLRVVLPAERQGIVGVESADQIAINPPFASWACISWACISRVCTSWAYISQAYTS